MLLDPLDELLAAAADARAHRVDRDPESLGDRRVVETVHVAHHDRLPELRITVADILAAVHDVEQRLGRLKADPVRASAEDALAQLDRLVRPGFVVATGAQRLPDVLRYVRGIARRLDKVPDDPAKDRRKLAEVHALEGRYGKLLKRLSRDEITPEVIDVGWMLEELRIQVFAEAIGTARPVSTQRVVKELQRLGG